MKPRKVRPWVFLPFFVGLIIPSIYAAEDSIYRFRNVERWVGTIHTTQQSLTRSSKGQCDSGKGAKLTAVETIQIQGSSRARVNIPLKIDRSQENQPGHMEVVWGADQAGSGRYQWIEQRRRACGNFIETFSGSGSLSEKLSASVEIVKVPDTPIRGYIVSAQGADVPGSTREYVKMPGTGFGSTTCDPNGNCSFSTTITNAELLKARAIAMQMKPPPPPLSGREKRAPYIRGVGGTYGIAESGPGNPFPESGNSIWGSAKLPIDHPDTGEKGSITVSWNLFAEGRSDYEAEVEIEDYEDWLPEGSKDQEKAGGYMTLHIRMKDKKTGKYKPHLQVSSYRLKLIDVSEKPGVAINEPLKNPSAKPDLRFEKSMNAPPDLEVKEDGMLLETRKKKNGYKGELKNIILSSFDWGGFGDLVVTVEVDGVPVIGHLKGFSKTKVIPIPKRSENSDIADAWKKKYGVPASQTDDADEDAKPQGDGHKGDGLSLYEEYRGFYAKGLHVYGDPHGKDFFLRNQVAGAGPGIRLFEKESGLKVHLIDENQMNAHREIDFNSQPKKKNSQHAVVMQKGSGGEASYAEGGPGVPAKITSIFINMLSGLGTTYGKSHIAHELFHSASVWHHGEGDSWKTTWEIAANPATGKPEIIESGIRPVKVFSEDGEDLTEAAMGVIDRYVHSKGKPMPVFIGEKNGQHSGHEDCIMRYAVAYAYKQKDLPRYVRILTGGEQTGLSLCSVVDGSDVNAIDRAPMPYHGPRYENANLERRRGLCQLQICINDRYAKHAKHKRD